MNAVDILAGLVLLVSALIGFARGAMREVVALAAFALAWVVSLAFERRYRTIRDVIWNGGERVIGSLRRTPAGGGVHRPAEPQKVLVADPDN